MDRDNLKELLKNIKKDKISINDAIAKLQHLPYDDLDFAKIDTHRELRQDFPEAIYCAGKTNEQILSIIKKMLTHKINILATKACEDNYNFIKEHFPEAKYNKLGKTIIILNKKPKTKRGLIAVVTAGTSDIPVAEEAHETLAFAGYKTTCLYDVGVAGIHRILDNREVLFKANVIITIAGMDGALPSVIAGLARCPIIAVPTSAGYGASFGGVAALLTMLNSCAPGLAVVNIDNGFGAARLAISILNNK